MSLTFSELYRCEWPKNKRRSRADARNVPRDYGPTLRWADFTNINALFYKISIFLYMLQNISVTYGHG